MIRQQAIAENSNKHIHLGFRQRLLERREVQLILKDRIPRIRSVMNVENHTSGRVGYIEA